LNVKKNILICPLEWGLGHAGRMVPLARYLANQNHNIFFGSGEEHLAFFRREVPGATYIHFSGFRIKYSAFLPQYLIILLKTPLLLYHIVREHKILKKIISDHSIDIVISDNRIGLWSKKVITVFVTHQLRIIFPGPFRFLEFIGVQLIRSIIKKYSFCFVPDLDGELNVSGELSHGVRLPGNVRYIGMLSRFEGTLLSERKSQNANYLVILSGPEPQRSILKKKLSAILSDTGNPAVFLEGNPAEMSEPYSQKNIIYYSHPDEEKMLKLITESKTIITRGGYTAIMELISLGRGAILIPTPGQTEQEYLAKYLASKGWFISVKQKDLCDKIILSSTGHFEPSGILERSSKLLNRAIEELQEYNHEQTPDF
jgi:uncharacterized protein (TIGR00661 family)